MLEKGRVIIASPLNVTPRVTSRLSLNKDIRKSQPMAFGRGHARVSEKSKTPAYFTPMVLSSLLGLLGVTNDAQAQGGGAWQDRIPSISARRDPNEKRFIVSADEVIQAMMRKEVAKVVIEGDTWQLQYKDGHTRYFSQDLSDKVQAVFMQGLHHPGNFGLNPAMNPDAFRLFEQRRLEAQKMMQQLKDSDIVFERRDPARGVTLASGPAMDRLDPALSSNSGVFSKVDSQTWWNIAFLSLFITGIGLSVYMYRKSRNSYEKDPVLGKSKSKEVAQGEIPKVTMEDVAGMEEVVKQIQDLLTILKKIQAEYAQAKEVSDEGQPDLKEILNGAKLPKGVLLEGPPGTGKTMLVKAIANEAKCPFFYVNGSEFIEKFVGVGASRVRELFAQIREAAKKGPVILMIDELDGLATTRDGHQDGGSQEKNATINQFLSELDGFNELQNVMVFATTNRADLLDPAFIRDGRFDRKIAVRGPVTPEERERILKVHLKGKRVAPGLDTLKIARKMGAGAVGAEIASITNQAAINSVLRVKEPMEEPEIIEEDFLKEIDNRRHGLEKEGIQIDEAEKQRTAGHEAVGHALVAWARKVPFDYISIVPRHLSGMTAMGMVGLDVEKLPQYGLTREYFENLQRVALAGRAAEEVFYGGDEHVSSGASNDWKHVNKSMRHAVTEYTFYRKEVGDLDLSPWETSHGLVWPSDRTRRRAERFIDLVKLMRFTRKPECLSRWFLLR